MTVLYERVVERSREIRTDAYSMSIGEVISMYRDGDLEIHPEFQRIFRWSLEQRSRLIESILLGIPIPTVFVAQREDGIWDVIDGVQRLSTILEFVGEYVDENGELQPPSALTRGEYLAELDGVGWSENTSDAKNYLNDALRRDFKRAKLSFSIIKRDSDPNAKYDLFQRLNAGSTLSLQEARNCLLIMTNGPAYDAVEGLQRLDSFIECVPLSSAKEDTAYRAELVLRFFCQRDYKGGRGQLPDEFGSYLTEWMKRRALESVEFIDTSLFERTFSLLSRAIGADTFRRFDGKRHLGPFLISSYEFITTGVAEDIDKWEERGPEELADAIRQMWSDESFKETFGGGVSSRKRFPQIVNNAREYFQGR